MAPGGPSTEVPLGTSLSSSKQEHHTSSKEEQEQALKKICKPWPSLAAGLSIPKARLEVGMEWGGDTVAGRTCTV